MRRFHLSHLVPELEHVHPYVHSSISHPASPISPLSFYASYTWSFASIRSPTTSWIFCAAAFVTSCSDCEISTSMTPWVFASSSLGLSNVPWMGEGPKVRVIGKCRKDGLL